MQSLQLDVSELMEPEKRCTAQRRLRVREEEIGSVVGVLDRAALLAQLDQRLREEPGMTEAEAFNRAIAPPTSSRIPNPIQQSFPKLLCRSMIGKYFEKVL